MNPNLLAPPPFPALWLYAGIIALIVFFVFFVISLEIELRKVHAQGERRTSVGRRLSDAAVWTLHPLMGTDGRLSFSKLITCAVLAHYAISSNLPAVVACWVIAASFGVKVLLAVIERTGLTVNSATELKAAVEEKFSKEERESHSTVDINETKRIIEERGPEGEPPRSLPATGAKTPMGEE